MVHFEVPKEKIKIPTPADIEEARKGFQVKNDNNQTAEEPKEVIVQASGVEIRSVTDMELKEAWEKLKAHFVKAGNISLEVILNRPFEQMSEGELSITLENEILKDTFDKNKPEIHFHFRSFLKAGPWNINAKVGQSQTHFVVAPVFSAQEKIQLLIDKYPGFEELRNVLGLEIE